MAATWAILLLSALPSQGRADAVPLRPDPPRFTIKVPDVVLTAVPVSKVTITARNLDGTTNAGFEGRPLIRGIMLSEDGKDTALPPFKFGVLELTTDLAADRKVYITAKTIEVDQDNQTTASLSVRRIPSWLSIAPPLVAIALAIWLRNVIVALFVGVWSGGIILAHWNLFQGSLRTVDSYLLDELIQTGTGEQSHMLIVLFTMFLGAMVAVMAKSGGTHALVNRLARFTQTRGQTQLLTWALGLVVFFDDYANTIMVGSTMRPVTDRLRISREKLAFLVDSTSAPVAGLAIISTWVGVELSYIADTYSSLGLSGDAYAVLLASIPYRFYPLQLLAFVWLIAYTGHDYGPMLRAEARALAFGQLNHPDSSIDKELDEREAAYQPKHTYLRNALVPLATLLGLILVGFWWGGSNSLAADNLERLGRGEPQIASSVWSILDHANPNRVLFLASFAASAVAVILAAVSKSLKLNEAVEAWLDGARGMMLALVILVLAWGIATVCDQNHLNTAGLLIEWTEGKLSVAWMPALAFSLSAVVALATGSSWSTMGLLMPVSLSMTYQMLVDVNEGDNPLHHILLATSSAVLAGSIFGDHCSPISDTTVLSSAASRSDHLEHVRTQMPYAISVALISLFLGYVPAGFGYSPIILLPLGLLVLYLVVQFVGTTPDAYAARLTLEAESEVPQLEIDPSVPQEP